MELAVLVILAVVVALVAVDAIARFDERGQQNESTSNQTAVTTQKIIVDLTNRQ